MNKPYVLSHKAAKEGMHPSIWLLATCEVDGMTHLAVLNPAYKRGPDGAQFCLGPDGGFGDSQSFLHFPSRRALGGEISRSAKDARSYTLDYTAAAQNMLWYFTGHEMPSTAKLTHLYHESTPLFSGDRENKDVHLVHLDLGKMPFVPPILEPKCDTVPPAMLGKKEMIERCAIERQSMAWMPLEDVVAGIGRLDNEPLNPHVCSPSDTPFIFRDLPNAKTKFPAVAGQVTKVQQSVVFSLQELCKAVGLTFPKRITDLQLAKSRAHWGYPNVTMKAARSCHARQTSQPK